MSAGRCKTSHSRVSRLPGERWDRAPAGSMVTGSAAARDSGSKLASLPVRPDGLLSVRPVNAPVLPPGEAHHLSVGSEMTRSARMRPRPPRQGGDKATKRQNSEVRRRPRERTGTEEQYRAISEVVSDWAYAIRVEPDGRPVSEWTSLNIQRISGYTPTELSVREGWLSLAHPEDRPTVRAHLDALLAGSTDIVEYRIVTKSGEVRWLRDYARPLAIDAGAVTVVGGVRDITARRQAEMDRARLLSELESAAEELERLTRAVSTDLWEPLTSLGDSLEGLVRDLEEGDPEKMRADVESSRVAASRIRDMLSALRTRATRAAEASPTG